MDLLTIVGAVFSRWFVVVPVLALTAFGANMAVERTEIEYTANGSGLLVNPQGIEEVEAAAETPESDLDMSGTVIAELVQSDQTRLALSEQGAAAPYTVEAEREGRILRVTSSAEAPEGVVETVLAVLNQIGSAVAERQTGAGVPDDRRITVETLVEPVEATPQTVRDEVTGDFVTRWSAVGIALLVEPPPSPPAPSNPLDASRYLANVLEHEMRDDELEQSLLDSEGVLSYSVGEDRTDAAPILYLSVTGTQPGEVMRTYDRLTDALEARLAEIQTESGAPEGTWISFRSLSTPLEPEADTSGALRPALTVVALGVFAAVSLAVLVDGLLSSRRRSRRAAKAREPQWVSNGATGRSAAAGNGSQGRGRVITLPEPPDREAASSAGRRSARRRHSSDA